MSETPFSKGPWRHEYRDGADHIRDANGKSLMCDESYYPWVPDNTADWDLIAASPDLYAALHALVMGTLSTTDDERLNLNISKAAFKAAEAALAKAYALGLADKSA